MNITFAEPTEARALEILDAYLAELRAGRVPDREALLARYPDLAESLAASFRALDFVQGAGSTLKAPEAPPDPPTEGRMLGDYRLVREIGRGGMAVVYEAEQISLGRRVALKVLPFAAVLDPKQLQRFKNEAQAAANLHHPHIVPVHAVGCERGVHYYAMQFIEGQSLAVAIRDLREGGAGEGTKTPISSHGSHREPAYIRMAAAVGMQAAEALDHAHQLGIVHRDVKPGNLLVDLGGTLWITDFGLARSLNDVGLTITGELLGTIRYMSPEQALAKRVPIDHRTDIYSLGATLYELFTLEPAFPGDDPHRVIQDVAFKEPVLPRRLNPALPRDLETVLLKAMSKDPAGRYATAQELADDLRRYLANRPIEASRPGLLRRAAKWGRRHRAVVGTAAGVLLLAVVGLVTGTALLWREKDQTRAAFERADANLALALKALDHVYLEEAEGNPRIREGLPRDLLQRGLGFYEEFAKENVHNQDVAGLMGRAYHRAGLIFREMGDEARAEKALDEAVSTHRAAIRRWPDDSRPHFNLGAVLFHKGDFDGAIAAFREAIRLQPDFAGAHGNLGAALLEKGDHEDAIRECREAVRLAPEIAALHGTLAIALKTGGDLDGAIREYGEAIRLDPRHAATHYNLGHAFATKGNMDDALAAYREAIALDPTLAEAHSAVGQLLRDKGDAEGAILACREAIRLQPDLASAHFRLGDALRAAGDPGGAIAEYLEAIRIEPDDADAYCNLGATLKLAGDPDGAIRACREAIRLQPGMADAHSNLGAALLEKGDFDGAIAAFREAIRLRPDFAGAHGNLGTALLEKGDLDGAIAAYREAIRLKPDFAGAHGNLGAALLGKGDFDGAIASCREAIRLRKPGNARLGNVLLDKGRADLAVVEYPEAFRREPEHAYAHFNLGKALRAAGDAAGAVAAYRDAIRLQPDLALAHKSLGNTLLDQGEIESAIASYETAVRLAPTDALAHYGLGNALSERGDTDGATREFREAIRLKPDHAESHCNLGFELMDKGQCREALACFRKGHELGSSRRDWDYPSKDWVEDAERRVKTESRLDQVLSGEVRPRDAAERIAFAMLLYKRSRHADAARMCMEAFAEDAALAEDLAKDHRYNAACLAARAAERGAPDATEWRGRALGWLSADLAARRRAKAVATLAHWKEDPDLASVRDRLGDLPGPERETWREFWAAVDEALASAGQASPR